MKFNFKDLNFKDFNYKEKLPKQLHDPVHMLALGFGSGLAPKAPGTFGTLAAIPLFLLLSLLPLWLYIVVVIAACTYGVHLCGKTADDMQVHDHGSIVWDEVAGMFITFLFVPITAPSLLAGFVLFRIFDILKPWPISFIDKNCHGGFGIMLDDIVAGIAAWACMMLIFY